MHRLSRGLRIASAQGGYDLAMLADKVAAAAGPGPPQRYCAQRRLLTQDPQILHPGRDSRVARGACDGQMKFLLELLELFRDNLPRHVGGKAIEARELLVRDSGA